VAIYTIRVTTTGEAGSAVGEATALNNPFGKWPFSNRAPFLWALKVDYHASAPETTDVVISEDGGLGRTLLTLSNRNTDGVFYPRYPTHDATGVEENQLEAAVLEGPLKVSVAGCNALDDAVVVTAQIIASRAAG